MHNLRLLLTFLMAVLLATGVRAEESVNEEPSGEAPQADDSAENETASADSEGNATAASSGASGGGSGDKPCKDRETATGPQAVPVLRSKLLESLLSGNEVVSPNPPGGGDHAKKPCTEPSGPDPTCILTGDCECEEGPTNKEERTNVAERKVVLPYLFGPEYKYYVVCY